MSAPIVDPTELATFLGVDAVDNDRAVMLLGDAQDLCESILTPLPATAAGIVRRVAARAYTNVTSAHQMGIGSANISYGAQNSSTGVGGMYLSRSDKADLRRLAGGGGAFSIDLLPADYSADLPPWDYQGQAEGSSL